MRALFVLLASIALGCSGAPSGDAPDYEIDYTAKRPAAPSDPESEPEGETKGPSDPAKPPSVFRASLAATTKVSFGGAPYCRYEVTLRSVSIEVSIAEGGAVTAALVKDTVVEAAPGCATPPMKPAPQVFTLASSTATTTGTHLEFTGAAENQPKTTLTLDLVSKIGGGYDATARWKRIDQKAPLDWLITSRMVLAK